MARIATIYCYIIGVMILTIPCWLCLVRQEYHYLLLLVLFAPLSFALVIGAKSLWKEYQEE